MPARAETRLRQFYVRFGERRFADLMEFLSRDVWYAQLNSMTARNSPRGPQAVGEAYPNWGRWFPDFRITPIEVVVRDEDQVRKVGGAESAFQVVYGLVGQYAVAIPGLREMPQLVVGSRVGLVMTDNVWMNGAQQLNRVTNTIQLTER